MKKEMLEKLGQGGVLPAIVTPKTKNDKIDFEAIPKIVDFLLSKGVDGFHVCGTTGEFATLPVNERKLVLEECVKATKGRGLVICQVGSVATKDVCELAKHAAESGADAVSSVPPYYYPATTEIILNHYRRISEASGIPVIIYDNPLTTGKTITPEMARELSEEGTVHGIKLARNDMHALARFSNLNSANFIVYPVETFYLSGLVTANRAGTIGSMSNWIPEVFVGIKRNFEQGNLKRAASLQRLVSELISVYVGEEMACTKALMQFRGIDCGIPWEPLLPLTSEQKRQLYEAIEAFDLDFNNIASLQTE